MSTSPSTVRGAHLVGSVNLPDAESVFRTTAALLGDRLTRIPDGETGARGNWISFQLPIIGATPGIVRVGDEPNLVQGVDYRPIARADGVDAADVALPPLGYAAGAIESYATFRRLRDEGVIRPGTRFLVALPTAVAVVGGFIAAPARPAFEGVYARALYRELDEILAAIPHGDLAIQWDVAVEFQYIEGLGYWGPLAVWWDDLWTGLVERAHEQLSHVPADVEVGFHLCYGDLGEAHFVEPTDAGNLARFANAVTVGAPRAIDWFHLPVPIGRDDPAYFAPLEALAIGPAELYLGLVHREDGAEGAARRIAAASAHVRAFGVGTECGIGRAPREAVEALLSTHRAVAAAV
jgi:hypothetical protein